MIKLLNSKKLSEAQDEATKAGADFLLGHQKIAAQLPNNTAQITAISAALTPFVEENDKLSTTLDNNSLALQYNALQGELQRKGTLEQQKALQDMQMQIETNKGSLSEYAKQVEDGTITNAAFTLGQQEQTKALLDSKVEIASTNGVLSKYISQIQSGEQQQVAFTQGQQQIVKQFADTIVETGNLNGQFSALELALGNAGAAQIEFNNGFAKGRVETAQMIISMDNLRGSFNGTREVLMQTAGNLGLVTTGFNTSNEALAQFIGVIKGAPDAVSNLVTSFTDLANNIVSSLAEAMRQGEDEVDDALDKIEETIGTKLTDPQITVLKVEADTSNAVQSISTEIGIALKAAAAGSKEAFGDSMDEAIDIATDHMKDSSGKLKTQWGTVIADLQEISKDGIGTKELINDVAKLSVHLSEMGVSGSDAKLVLQGIGLSSAEADAALKNAGYSADQLTAATGKLTPELQKMVDEINRMNTVDSAATQIFTVNIPGYVTTMAAAVIAAFTAAELGSIQALNTIDSTATQIFTTNIPSYPIKVSDAVTDAFTTAKDQGISLMSELNKSVNLSFENMAEQPALVSEAVDSEFGKASDDGKNLIQALERAVKSSCDAMASAFEKVASAVDKIGESAKNAESDVDSLKKAVESLPNIDRKITYHIETVGSKPKGAQFGTNMLVDKPQMLLVGEGFGKERVKVSPGTMPFAEDFTREMNHKFEVQRSVISANGQPGQPGTNANGTSTNNGTSISTPGQPGANGQPGTSGANNNNNNNNPNIYAPGYQGVPTNQSNNPDLGNGSTGMMISNNASLVQMNNSNGKRMIIDGKTGTVIMLDSSASSSNTNNTNTNTGGGSGSNSSSGDIVGQNNNVNIDNDTNNKNNVYAPGYGSNNNTTPTTPIPNTGSSNGGGNGVTQTQTNNQSGSGGQNYYYQSQTNNGVTKVNSNIPAPPGMVNQSAASSGNTPISSSYSSDSRSRLLARGDPLGFQNRVVHETPIEVNIDLEGVRLARKIIKILTEEFGFGSGYYG